MNQKNLILGTLLVGLVAANLWIWQDTLAPSTNPSKTNRVQGDLDQLQLYLPFAEPTPPQSERNPFSFGQSRIITPLTPEKLLKLNGIMGQGGNYIAFVHAGQEHFELRTGDTLKQFSQHPALQNLMVETIRIDSITLRSSQTQQSITIYQDP